MVVLSTLCRLNSVSKSLNISNVCRILISKKQNAFLQTFRNMSGGDEDRKMHITPSRFQYTRFKDDLHFFITLGVVPLGLLILYVNIFIGPATLTEIPEDYEPKVWEYYRHPISRAIAYMYYEEPQIIYEKNLHGFVEEQEKAEWSMTIRKVHDLMSERDDYKAWYYRPSEQGRHIRFARYENDKLEELKGYR